MEKQTVIYTAEYIKKLEPTEHRLLGWTVQDLAAYIRVAEEKGILVHGRSNVESNLIHRAHSIEVPESSVRMLMED